MGRELKVSVSMAEGVTIEANVVDVLRNKKAVIVIIDDKPVEVLLDKVKFI